MHSGILFNIPEHLLCDFVGIRDAFGRSAPQPYYEKTLLEDVAYDNSREVET